MLHKPVERGTTVQVGDDVKPYPGKHAARYMLPVLKALVSVAALFYLAHNVDRATMLEALLSARGWFLVLAAAQMILIPLLGGARWQLVLRRLGHGMSLLSLTRMFWVGMAFNQVLPSAVGGDALRVLLACHNGLDVTTSAMSVLIERAMMMLSSVLVVVLAAWYAPVGTLDPWLITVAGVLLGVGLAGLAVIPAARWLLVRAPRIRVVRFAVHMVDGLSAVAFSSGAAPLILLCLVTNMNLSIAAWWLTYAFDLPLTLAQLFLFYVVFALAVALSSLPGLVLLWWKPRDADGGLAPVNGLE